MRTSPVVSRWVPPSAGFLLLLAASAPLFAQEALPVEQLAADNPKIQFPPSQVSSDIGLVYKKDVNRGQKFREVFKMTLRRGEVVVLDLQSKVFDAKLQVLAADGTELAYDDDSGDDGRSSRLLFAAPEDKTGPFYVVASSVDNREGNFVLTATARRAPAPRAVPEIRAGVPVEGRFDKTSAIRVDAQKIYASYWFDAEVGERVQIEGRSPAVSLELFLLRGGEEVKRGATTGEGASLYSPISTSGRHQVDVVTKSESLGAYILTLKKLPRPRPAQPPEPLPLDQPVISTFTAESPRLSSDSNRPIANYLLEGQAGDRIIVSAKLENTDGSPGYDPTPVTLAAGADTAAGFAEVRRATSAPGTAAAETTVNFTRLGQLVIQLVGRSGAVTGYRLEARRKSSQTSAVPEPDAD